MARRDGRQPSLTDEEINIFVRLLIIAGAGTTYKAYGNLMFLLLSHPEQLAAVARRPHVSCRSRSRSRSASSSHSPWVQRVAFADTTVGGVDVAAGCPVAVNIGAANHDPAQWGSDPETFDIFRDRPDRHLSFGFGIHRCLGIHLARAELNVLLNRTLDLLPNLALRPRRADDRTSPGSRSACPPRSPRCGMPEPQGRVRDGRRGCAR